MEESFSLILKDDSWDTVGDLVNKLHECSLNLVFSDEPDELYSYYLMSKEIVKRLYMITYKVLFED